MRGQARGLGCILSPSQMGSPPGGREGAVRRSRTQATVEAASSALSRGPSGALRRRWRCVLSPIADGGVRPQGGRGPSGAAGRKLRSVRASSALSRGPSGALRHLPAAARQGRGERGHVKDLIVQRAWRTRRASPDLGSVGAGRWRGARAGGPGTVGCVGVSAPDAVTLRGAGWTGGLASGDCPPSAGCRTRRLVRVTPARRAPPTRTRRARAHPTRPRTLRFSSPRRQTPARPTHAAASGADPGRPPHAAGSRGTMRPAGGASATLRSATADPLRRKRLHAARSVG